MKQSKAIRTWYTLYHKYGSTIWAMMELGWPQELNAIKHFGAWHGRRGRILAELKWRRNKRRRFVDNEVD